MARPVYPYELGDPDFSWLLATFQESHPGYIMVDNSGLPITLIDLHGTASSDYAEKPSDMYDPLTDKGDTETPSGKQ